MRERKRDRFQPAECRRRDALVIGPLLAVAGIVYLALSCNALAAASPRSPSFSTFLLTRR